MFETIFLRISCLAKSFRQSGQVSLLFALLMPVFLLFFGVVLDLGWYYLNVSRMQNAADAAAVAGAQSLVSKENFKDYKNIALVGKYPAKVSNEYRSVDDSEKKMINDVKYDAEKYVGKNLAGKDDDSYIDAWTKSKIQTAQGLYEKDENLYFVVQLREEIKHFFLAGWFDSMSAPVTAVALLSKNEINAQDTDTQGDKAETLNDNSEEPQMPSLFSSLVNDVTVSEEFNEEMTTIKNKSVIVGNWEVQNTYRTNNTSESRDQDTGEELLEFNAHFGYDFYKDRWNQYQDKNNHYTAGNHRRTETVIVTPNKEAKHNTGNNTTRGKDSNGKENNCYSTPANGYNIYSEEEVDSLNIDFKQDVKFKSAPTKDTTGDWDLTLPKAYSVISDLKSNEGFSGKESAAASMRIHTMINFNEAHKERSAEERKKSEIGKKEIGLRDILWVRIESEPMLSEPDLVNDNNAITSKIGKMTELNSVRQIILNFNASNAGNEYRPVVIFYDGPETFDVYASYREKEDVLHRKSLPVIVNLNADFNGILYMPNSPVVLNGKGYKFKGFIVAKEYKLLKTEDDFVQDPSNDEIYYTDLADKLNKYFKITDEHGNTMFIDAKGEVQYKDEADTRKNSPDFKYGEYNTFGRTNFQTYGYEILRESANNLLLSGK
ncbi:MAG: pilus assembly protein [Selenomonadaceae bacterium]|nr:pilus assembly protein [Selenomonadaceae bacterium]